MHDQNPYRLLSSKQVYENPWIKVREDSVARPEGHDGIFGLVTINDGVSVLPMDDEGNIYLIEEFQYAINRNTLLTISGGIDGDEAPLNAAQRELKEESGLMASEWTDLGTVESMTMLIDCTMHLYLARGLSFGRADHYDQQTIKLVKLPFQKAIQLVMESKIAPAAGNVLILKAAQYIKK